jgi:hypothetical protein
MSVASADDAAAAVAAEGSATGSLPATEHGHYFPSAAKVFSRGTHRLHSSIAGPVVALLPGERAPAHIYANAGPLGLSTFAGTTFLLSLANARIGFEKPDVVIGMAYFFGGVVQLIAGTWEFAAGNTFGATAFTAYGGFWLAYGYLVTPGTGVLAAYGADYDQLKHALGCFMVAWTIFTWMMTVAAHKTNVALFATLCFTSLSFPLTAAGLFTSEAGAPPNGLLQASGWVGICAAISAWYTALSGLLTPQTSAFTLPNPKL